ncbi:MAG TPA: DNA polymerase [Nitrososphaerales archaeon]|nr:DNA polymerase [Nitrososphaerales archaeon]
MIRRVKMKLSKETEDVLKNFADINQNILVEKGNVLRTVSTMKNILGRAEITEAFPKQFGIYDLNEFLGVLTMSEDPEIHFENESYLTIESGRSSVKYFHSDPSIIVSPPDTFSPPETNCKFSITNKLLTAVAKACAVLQLPDVVIREENSTTVMVATDLKNTTSHEYKVEVTMVGNSNGPVDLHFKIDNLKMIPGDYELHISTEKNVSHWVHTTLAIQYWIALEQSSGQ